MNLKTFAQESRTVMMEGVAKKLLYWGFSEKGEVLDEPQKISGGYLLRGEPFDDPNVPKLWSALKAAIATKGIEVVVEEAAYTWFNRMMAIKILAKNGYEDAQLSYVEGMQHTPMLLQRARQGNYRFLEAKEQERLKKIISDYNKDQEAFALLLTGYCHSHNTLNRVFGKLDDYTELLLPDNMLQDGGFLHLLNITDAISQDDYQTVELIGWLYQFYISEKKDEVFASFKKNKKAEAKDIPAATQIFTPNWIVKYMVENTAGKIWLDKHPDSALKGKMKYLVENESDGQNEAIISEVEELTLIDPACGSGHILVEGFDLLYQMYMEEYYTPEEAVASILKNNLFGLDIDDRAAQLATFAILLKAAKVYPDVWTKDWLPQVHAMPEAQNFSQQELKDFLGAEGEDYLEELNDALRLMKQAKNLGSVMKLKLSEEAHTYINQRFEELKTASYRDFNVEAVYQSIQNYIPVLLLLIKKYSSVVANPPYMGQKNMNGDLKNYLGTAYISSRNDLMTVFMEVCNEFTCQSGRYANINLPSWMFLASYKDLRLNLLKKNSIDSLVLMGRGVFGSDFGSVSFSILKKKSSSAGTYRKLSEDKVSVESIVEKERKFLDHNYGLYKLDQSVFLKLPDQPISFWLSNKEYNAFEKVTPLLDFATPVQGLATGENVEFLRFWQEVDFNDIGLNNSSIEEFHESKAKWAPYNKGGELKKWFGNDYYVIAFDQKNFNVLSTQGNRLPSKQFYFNSSISWSKVTLGGLGFRYFPKGFVFDVSGCSVFGTDDNLKYLMGALNSSLKESFVYSLSQSANYEVGQIKAFPIILDESRKTKITQIVNDCIDITLIGYRKNQETSWDFEQSPLLNEAFSLEQAYQSWQETVTQDFFQLHANEEELNRIFIDIYGLQEELTPEVALKDITILQEELDRKELERLEPIFREKGQDAIQLPIDRSEVISQFISYAIGLFMGRYRLDKPGLNIAHANPTTEELANYTHNGGQVSIDEDAILPLMGSNCNFPDDALHQVYGLLDTLWGHDTRTENINFIQECLDKDLEKFLVKDFYKYHCGMYKKKPIYWLFSSKKGAFQVLVYMHRMNEFTAEKIRANYLLEHIKNLRSEEAMLSANESNLSTQEARKLEQIRKDIHECEEYDMELKNVADQQIKFDLDDGVTANYELFKSVVAKIK
jgi:hypothetical protein